MQNLPKFDVILFSTGEIMEEFYSYAAAMTFADGMNAGYWKAQQQAHDKVHEAFFTVRSQNGHDCSTNN